MATKAETPTMSPAPRDFVAEAQSEVIANIGQIDHKSKLALERAVRAGVISKWRGHWFPIAGMPFGLGLKTCYGSHEMRDYCASWTDESFS